MPILVPGRNCWRIERAHRFAFLIDAAAYFDALAASLEQVERSVLLVGWDFHTKTVLRPDSCGRGWDFATWLELMVKRKPHLQVFLLEWDFSVLYALERDWTTLFGGFHGLDPSRVHFRLDGETPWSASQHQKIVLLDDAMVYVGGVDVTVNRWDTPEHRPDDPRRRLPSGDTYSPFHDIQVALDGPAARALGELAKARWKGATGEELPTEVGRVPWPDGLSADLTEVDVAIARTLPAQGERPGIREVEQLYLDAIAAARELIYIETQYFTASCVTEALERRLSEEDGPEIVLVLPERCSGWLEQSTMGVLRRAQLQRLMRADHFGRFRAVAPFVKQGEVSVSIMVHSKVFVVDERLARVGSSNLSRRSMGFDSECDVAIEAPQPCDGVSRAIRSFRNRLLAEHLGMTEGDVERHLEQHRSVISLIDGASSGERGVSPIELGEEDALVLDAELVDPQGPEAPAHVAQQFLNDDIAGASRHPWVKVTLALAVLLGLAAMWKWTPLAEWVKPERVLVLATSVREHPLAPLLVIGVYVVGSLLMVPITVLIMTTALTFGFWQGVGYSLVGACLGGVAGFGAGNWLGRDTVRRVSGPRLRRASELLGRGGLLSVVAVRLVPVAPFTIANLILGASHIGLRDFVLGSAIALLPGIVLINLFETHLHEAIARPTWSTVLIAVVIPIVAVLLLAVLRRALENVSRNGK